MKRDVLGVCLAAAACLVAGCDTAVPSWPEIVTSAFPPGSVGVPYSATVGATAGTPPYRFSLSGGSLPSGLSLAEDGTLSGTPLREEGASFTVQVADAANSTASRALSLVIQGGALTPLTTTLPDGQVSVAYEETLTATGGAPPYTWSISSGSLPSGLALSASGSITGTPTSPGASSFTVTVTDSAVPAAMRDRSLTITVTGGSASTSPLRVATTSLANASVDVAYSAQLGASGGTVPVSWTLDAASSLPPGLALDLDGTVSGTPTIAGQYDFTVIAADSSSPRQFASATLSIEVTSPSGNLAVTTASLPTGTAGSDYSHQLNAAGGTSPYSWSVAVGSVPAGLTLSSSGLLSGAPTSSGWYTFTVQVADSSSTTQIAQATLSLTINSNPSATLTVTTGNVPVGTVGRPYQAQLQAAGGVAPYAWVIIAGSLPNGLTLSRGGSIDGAPTAAGSFDFTIEVTDSSAPIQAAASKHFTLTVTPDPTTTLTISTASLPNGSIGVAYDAQLAGSGGATPYRFTLADGALPPGITLTTVGKISGAPTTAGSFDFTIRLTDSSVPAQWVERSYHLPILAGAGQLSITNSTLPSAREGMAYMASLNATGGTAPYHWSITGGALPSGVTLADDGSFSGAPTAPGTFTFTVKVTDSSTAPKSASKQLSIVVR